MLLKKLLPVLFLLGISVSPAIAQEEDDFEDIELQSFKTSKFDFSKVAIEPNIALGFTNNYFQVGLAPYVGYEVTKNFYTGPGFIYYFNQFRNVDVLNSAGVLVNRIKINEHTVGGGIFAQYYFYKQGFVRAKFEYLRLKNFSGFVNQDFEPLFVNLGVPVLLIGAGYDVIKNKNLMFPLMIAYDVIHDINSPYVSNNLQVSGGRSFPFYIQIGFVSYF